MNRDELKNLITLYVTDIETEDTSLVCLCEWLELDTAYGKRKIKQSVNMECPVHTREGLILGFVATMLAPRGEVSLHDIGGMDMCTHDVNCMVFSHNNGTHTHGQPNELRA